MTETHNAALRLIYENEFEAHYQSDAEPHPALAFEKGEWPMFDPKLGPTPTEMIVTLEVVAR